MKIDEIINDKKLIKLYKDVEDFENIDPNAMGYHNMQHALNVMNTATKIMRQLKIDEEEIRDMQIAAILHDIGAYCGKKGHQIRSYEMAKEYIENNRIKLKNKERVLNAILNHSSGFDNIDLHVIILIFSDKMDIKKTRVAPAGMKDDIMKQFLYIEDIYIEITETKLEVSIKVDEKCDKKKLESYYFIIKMANAVKVMANKLELKPVILFNNNKWLID